MTKNITAHIFLKIFCLKYLHFCEPFIYNIITNQFLAEEAYLHLLDICTHILAAWSKSVPSEVKIDEWVSLITENTYLMNISLNFPVENICVLTSSPSW